MLNLDGLKKYHGGFLGLEKRPFISENLYRKLAENFPNEEYFRYSGGSLGGTATRGILSNDEDPRQFEEFLRSDSGKAWEGFLKYIDSDLFVGQLRERIGAFELLWYRGFQGVLALRPWRKVTYGEIKTRSFSVTDIFFQKYNIGFTFSLAGDGSFLAPHTDGSSKYMTLLFYFPFNHEEKFIQRAGTVLYGLDNSKWTHGVAGENPTSSEFRVRKRFEYQSNLMVCEPLSTNIIF